MDVRGAAPTLVCPRCEAVVAPTGERMRTCADCGLTFDTTKARVPTQLVRRRGEPSAYTIAQTPERILLTVPAVHRTASRGLLLASVVVAICSLVFYANVIAPFALVAAAIVGAISAFGIAPSRIVIDGAWLTVPSRVAAWSKRVPRDAPLSIGTRVIPATPHLAETWCIQASVEDRVIALAHCLTEAAADEVAAAVRSALREVPRAP